MTNVFEIVRERVGYLLSLPERTIRSLAALVGGTTSLLTETLFPEVLRGTTLYRVFVGDAQQFLVQKVAQVHQEGQAAAEAGDSQYLQKKMVGGALETAGLFAMHLSPLWVLALAGDAAAGSGVFLDRLVGQLKRNGVLPETAEVKGVHDLLAALHDTARQSATAIDTPPLSREEVTGLADQLAHNYRQLFSRVTDLLPRLETIWQRMESIASRENISLERLGGILTVDVADWAGKGVAAVLAVGQTGSSLFAEKVLDSYSRTLDAVSEVGIANYLNQRMKPFLDAAAGHFDPSRKTWTESLAARLFARPDGPGADEPPPTDAPPPPPAESPPPQ